MATTLVVLCLAVSHGRVAASVLPARAAPARLGRACVARMSTEARPTSQQQRQSRWGDPTRIAHSAPGVGTPTARGETVDAKRLVKQEDVASMWLSHILVSSDEMAQLLLARLRDGADFEELAASASACEVTRAKGGAIGWVNREGEEPYVDALLPPEAQASAFSHKPGDVLCVPSALGVHLVKIDDVMMRLRSDTLARTRLSGAGSDLAPLVDAWGKRRAEAPGRPLTYEMLTMGCQMNAADSERMAGSLEAIGFQRLDDARAPPADGSAPPAQGKADIVVINTCSIRDHAEQKVYSLLGPYAIRKRAGEAVGIVVAGCVAQQEGARLLRRVPEVDVVMGPQYSNRLGDLLEDALNGNQVVATEPTYIMEDVTKPRRGSAVCAWVNVIYGCNERCTYCVVPGTRGVEQSRPMESIRKEMEELAAAGYKEVTLLGQNVDAYGRDMAPKRKFADLLRCAEARGAAAGLGGSCWLPGRPRALSSSALLTCPHPQTRSEPARRPRSHPPPLLQARLRRARHRARALRHLAPALHERECHLGRRAAPQAHARLPHPRAVGRRRGAQPDGPRLYGGALPRDRAQDPRADPRCAAPRARPRPARRPRHLPMH